MRFYLFGPRFLGIRPGISFQPSGLRSHKRPANAASSYIYVVRGELYAMGTPVGPHVKIGVTKDPPARLSQLQTGSSQKLDYAFIAPTSGDAYAIEKEAHAMLARSRLSGEWFDVPPELAIAAVTGAAAKLGQSLTAPNKEQEEDAIEGMWFYVLIFFGLVGIVIWMWIKLAISMFSNPS